MTFHLVITATCRMNLNAFGKEYNRLHNTPTYILHTRKPANCHQVFFRVPRAVLGTRLVQV